MDSNFYPLQEDYITSANLTIGSRLRMRRKELNITQQSLSQAIGISYQQIQKYENGSNRISADRLYYIANLLGVGISYFFKDSKADKNSDIKMSESSNDSEMIMNIQMSDLSPAIRTAMVNLIRTIDYSSTTDKNSS